MSSVGVMIEIQIAKIVELFDSPLGAAGSLCLLAPASAIEMGK
jgi:hypothetical protein